MNDQQQQQVQELAKEIEDTKCATGEGLSIGGRFVSDPYSTVHVGGDYVHVRIDCENNPEFWFDVQINAALLANWLMQMGYSVTRPAAGS